jgi:hypothetical protein
MSIGGENIALDEPERFVLDPEISSPFIKRL